MTDHKRGESKGLIGFTITSIAFFGAVLAGAYWVLKKSDVSGSVGQSDAQQATQNPDGGTAASQSPMVTMSTQAVANGAQAPIISQSPPLATSGSSSSVTWFTQKDWTINNVAQGSEFKSVQVTPIGAGKSSPSYVCYCLEDPPSIGDLIVANDFGKFKNMFIGPNVNSKDIGPFVRGIPSGAQTVDANGTLLAEAKLLTIEHGNPGITGLILRERQYGPNGAVVYESTFHVVDGHEVGESHASGNKASDYYSVWPMERIQM